MLDYSFEGLVSTYGFRENLKKVLLFKKKKKDVIRRCRGHTSHNASNLDKNLGMKLFN